jgi:hypothetical protein
MDKETERKYIILAEMQAMVEKEPKLAFEIMSYAINGLIDYKKKLAKHEANLWLVVKNLKPEHLEEIKKLIIPEVFEDLEL